MNQPESSSYLKHDIVDLPTITHTIWDTVPAVNRGIAEHTYGQFLTSSLLIDAFGADDRIAGVTSMRIETLLGLPMSFEPNKKAGKSAVAKKIAEDLEQLWPKMAPRSALAEVLHWSHNSGTAISQLRWDTNGSKWLPTICPWHPMYSFWDWGDRKYKISTQSDALITIDPEDPKWFLWTRFGYQRGWMKGWVRSLAKCWLIRKFTYRDWARYCEKHGMPITKAITPSGTDDKEKAKFLKRVSALGTDSTIKTEKNQDGEAVYDVDLLEAKANTYEGFQFLIEKVEESATILILGQNLTTQVKEGSRAAAQVHDKVRGDLLRADAESFSEALQDGPVEAWTRLNYDAKNAEELAPRPCWETDPPEDKGEKSAALFALGQAFVQFNTAGVAVDKKQICDDFGVPVVGDGEMDPVVPAAPAGGDKEKPEDDSEPKKAKATLSRGKPGFEAGQEYADDIADTGIDQGRKALMPDLAAVLEHVRLSKSPDELKGRLLKAFGQMSPMKLARILERGTVLARMNGMHSVLEDI